MSLKHARASGVHVSFAHCKRTACKIESSGERTSRVFCSRPSAASVQVRMRATGGITFGADGCGDGAPPHAATTITTKAAFTTEGY
jgi:hypothetical protein